MRELIKTENSYVIRITGEEIHRETYEVAAWFTDVKLDEGEYACTVTDVGGYWEAAGARIPGTVVRNNHAPLFGGVAVAPSRDDSGQRTSTYVKARTSYFVAEGY